MPSPFHPLRLYIFPTGRRHYHSLIKSKEVIDEPLSVNASTQLRSVFPEEYGFSAETLKRGYHPMDEIAFYMTILAAMYDLCWLDQQRPQADFRTWQVPGYSVRVALKADSIGVGVYGLLSAAIYGLKTEFWPMILRMNWDGSDVGQINISYQASLSGNLSETTLSGIESLSSTESTNSTSLSRSAINVGAPTIHYNIETGTGSITVEDLFGSVLRALVDAAVFGYKSVFRGFSIDGVFAFKARKDVKGVPLMIYADLIRVMTFIATDTVKKNTWNEFIVTMIKDGMVIGEGYVKAPTDSSIQ